FSCSSSSLISRRRWAAGLLGEGAALEGLQVALACSLELAESVAGPVCLRLEGGLAFGGALACARERALKDPTISETCGDHAEQLLLELVGGDPFAVAAAFLAVAVASEAGVVAVAAAAPVSGR